MTFLSFLFFISFPTFSQRISDFNIETRDLATFWRVYELFSADTTKNPFGQYLKNGTAGLRMLDRHRMQDSVSLKKVIQKNLAYYDQARKTSINIDSVKTTALQYFTRFKDLYPAATLPHIYFIIGGLNTHVATINDTILIGIENFLDQQLTTIEGRRSSLATDLPLTLARVIILTNQKPAHTGWTLLRQCVLHGTTEFILGLLDESEKLKLLSLDNFLYGEAHEEALVKEFLLLKDDDNFQGWLYNDSEQIERPKNLGYWIGYKIVQSYYNNAVDKSKAISDILKINDFNKFLLLSGYAETFRY